MELTQPDADLRAAIRAIVEDIASEFDLVPGEAPSTTLAVLRVLGEIVEVLVVADSPIIVKTSNGEMTQVRDDRISEISSRYPRPPGKPDRRLPEWVNRYRAIERHRNEPGGFWAISASPDVADEAVTASFELAEVESALLMTDGISVLGDTYDTGGWLPIYDTAVSDPGHAIHRTFELERSDHGCTRWPRSKTHDDKAVASVTFS